MLVGETDSIDDALQPTTVDRLRLLPAGPNSPSPAELLGSQRMVDLMRELSERADVVVLDAPPFFSVADAGILASLVTGTILVADIGRTKLQGFALAVDAIRKVGGVVLGAVLNRLDPRHQSGYYYSGYYGYYGHAYGDDGRDHQRSGRRRRHRKEDVRDAED